MPNPQRRRILVVEDEFLIADDISVAFARLGIEVVGPAQSVKRAMELIESSNSLDGAVLDISLAGELVFPVADVLKQRGIPFVFATGFQSYVVPKQHLDVARHQKPLDLRAIVKGFA